MSCTCEVNAAGYLRYRCASCESNIRSAHTLSDIHHKLAKVLDLLQVLVTKNTVKSDAL